MEDRISQEIRDSAPCWLRLQDPLPLVCNFKQMWANGHCPASQLLWTYLTKGSVFFVILTTCCTFCLFHKKEHIFLGTSQKEHTESLAYRWSDPQSTTSQVSSYRRSWDPMEQVWGVCPNLRKLFWGRCGYHYRAKGEASKIKNKKKTEEGFRQDQIPRPEIQQGQDISHLKSSLGHLLGRLFCNQTMYGHIYMPNLETVFTIIKWTERMIALSD